jgi:hypothetical protein
MKKNSSMSTHIYTNSTDKNKSLKKQKAAQSLLSHTHPSLTTLFLSLSLSAYLPPSLPPSLSLSLSLWLPN